MRPAYPLQPNIMQVEAGGFMEEIWKPVVGYEGLYEVSNLGRVKSLERDYMSGGILRHRHHDRILSNIKNSNGYVKVQLYNNGVCKQLSVHRLVAGAFIPNPEGKEYVNHLNGKKDDNRAKNLEWCTPIENNTHSIKVLGHRKTGMNGSGGPKRIRCVETGIVFSSIMEASRATGVHHTCLLRCLKRPWVKPNKQPYRRSMAGGYHWEYA